MALSLPLAEKRQGRSWGITGRQDRTSILSPELSPSAPIALHVEIELELRRVRHGHEVDGQTSPDKERASAWDNMEETTVRRTPA